MSKALKKNDIDKFDDIQNEQIHDEEAGDYLETKTHISHAPESQVMVQDEAEDLERIEIIEGEGDFIDGQTNNDSFESSLDLDSSILQEYWEDFNNDGEVRASRGKPVFTKIDDIKNSSRGTSKVQSRGVIRSSTIGGAMTESLQKMGTKNMYGSVFKDFDPKNPSLLKHYDRLGKVFKMPSRELLFQEKLQYIKYMEKLKFTNRILMTRAKKEAREKAKAVLQRHIVDIKNKFEKEIMDLILKHSEVKDVCHEKDKVIEHLNKELKDQEYWITDIQNYFRNRNVAYKIECDNEKWSDDKIIEQKRLGIAAPPRKAGALRKKLER